LYVPFGLCNVPATFKKYINSIFTEQIKRGKVKIFMDDFIISAKDDENNLEILKEVLKTTKPYGLRFN